MTTPNLGDSLPEFGPGSLRRRRFFLGVSALITIAVLAAARAVLLPFLLAVVLAYVLSPIVQAGERLRFRGKQAPRWVVVVCLYVGLLGTSTTLVVVSLPRLSAELSRLASEAPRVVAQVRTQWIPAVEKRLREASERYLDPLDLDRKAEPEPEPEAESDVPAPKVGPRLDPSAIQVRPRADGGYEVALPAGGLHVVQDGETGYRILPARPADEAKSDIAGLIKDLLGGAMESTERSAAVLFTAARKLAVSLSRGIFTFVLTLMLSAYLLITSHAIFEFFRSMYQPARRHEFDDLVRRIDRGLAGVVRGQLIICLVNAVLSGIGFWVLGLKYWVFLTLVAGVMSIVPIFGSILSTIPAVLIALPEGIGLAAAVLAWIVAIHQLEANVFNPKIMGDAARVHPVLVVFALLAGEHLAGILGALLAVPALSITQTVFLHLRERFLGIPRGSSLPPPAPSS